MEVTERSPIPEPIKWMYHATAMSPSYEESLSQVQRLFGAQVLHYNESDAPGIERNGGMVWMGANALEIGEPNSPESPVQRFLSRFGGGLHSIAVQVENVVSELSRLQALGVGIADVPLPGVAFTRPADTAGLLFEWHSNEQEDDPRWEHVNQPSAAPSKLPIRQWAFVSALVADPDRDGRRLSQVLGTALVPLPSRHPAEPAYALSLGDCMLALHQLPDKQDTCDIWGGVQGRPRFASVAFVVDDVPAAVDQLRSEPDFAVCAVSETHQIVQARSLPFPLTLVDCLLSVDPRTTSP